MLFSKFWFNFFKSKKDKKDSKIFFVMDEIKTEISDKAITQSDVTDAFNKICKTCKDSTTSITELSNKLSDQFVILQKNKNAFDELVNELFAEQDNLNKIVSSISTKWTAAVADIIKLKGATRAVFAKKEQLFNDFPVRLGIANEVSVKMPIDNPGYFAEIQRQNSIKDNTWKILNVTILASGSIEMLLFKDGKTIKQILARNFVDNPGIGEILSMCVNFNKKFPAKYLLSGKLSNEEKSTVAAGILFLKKKILFAISSIIPQLQNELAAVADFEKFVANEMLVNFSEYIKQ